MATAFVVHYGPDHPSLAVAPQVPESIYYWLPRASEAVLGFSEVAYRIPSVLAMGLALFLIARLAARLIHRDASWLAAFAMLALRGINYQAADARPYALGTCLAAAAMWFLVRWFDRARWWDALLFAIAAALLWPTHLLFAPLYAVFGTYAVVRLAGRDTALTWKQCAAVFAAIALALTPILREAFLLGRQAGAHVITTPPPFYELFRIYKFGLLLELGGGAWLLSRILQPKPVRPSLTVAALVLIGGWWLWHPFVLFAFSRLSGDSVFVSRYLSLALPGAVLAATACAAFFLPDWAWKPAATLVGACVLLYLGDWGGAPEHHPSDWRAAAGEIRALHIDAATPIIYPSPFIEAKAPAWRPDYPLPGFLYCETLVYKVGGTPYLFPFDRSPDADRYAARLARGPLSSSRRFLIYGGETIVRRWQRWFARRPELRAWTNRELGPFGDVDVALFENPQRVRVQTTAFSAAVR